MLVSGGPKTKLIILRSKEFLGGWLEARDLPGALGSVAKNSSVQLCFIWAALHTNWPVLRATFFMSHLTMAEQPSSLMVLSSDPSP